MTSSIENAFGARIMVRGFLLNNQLTDFSFLPRDPQSGALIANRPQPGKRPRSSMAPTLVFDQDEHGADRLYAVLGSPGGSHIINFVAKTLVGLLDWQLSAQQAIALANFGSRNGPTEIEAGSLSPTTIQALQRRGHQIKILPLTSGTQAIVRTTLPDGRNAWQGGTDPRREGSALGR